MATKPQHEPFAKPLSSDYIRDRLDIDDPLYGFQIRHKYGGWMQGFILYTTFTTWNYDFEFNSQHPLCGIRPPPPTSNDGTVSDGDHRYVDYDNSLAMELEALTRSGDPSVGGIVFSEIAEISILGALGCGEYLLRMALDDIYTNKQNYKYVILHAADQARAFYEKFGFKRVGAVCKYSQKQNIPLTPDTNVPEQPQLSGYRHWTHANEAILHDAPSYMMCLKLPDRCANNGTGGTNPNDTCHHCGGIVPRRPPPGEFLRQMLQFQVSSKPRIEPLGTSTVLGLKHLTRRSHSMPLVVASPSFESQSSCPNLAGSFPNMCMNHPTGKKTNTTTTTGTKASRRKSLAAGSLSKASSFRSNDVPSASLSMRAASMNPLNGSLTNNAPPKTSKRQFKREPSSKDPISLINNRPTKRLKVERAQESLLADPKRSSFIEKQYNSVWLAVPPNMPGTVMQHRERAPPKSRTDAAAVVRKPRKKSSTLDVPIEATLNNVLNNTGASIQGTIKQQSRSLSPVLEEVDELQKYVADENTATNVKSRPKRSGGDKATSSVQLPMKISRKRTFTDAIIKSDRMKASYSTVPTIDETDMTSSPPRTSLFDLMSSEDFASVIDPTTLRKQKVLSYPRNRIHYYNRVVRQCIGSANGTPTKGNDDATCYFVLEYNEDNGMICIVPMIVRGILTGKRTGRPRYQCQMDQKFIIAEATKYYIVPSAMIMKTPIISQEAWDIATDNDTEFLTR